MSEDRLTLPNGTERSERLHEAATSVFPGGVSHNIRYFDPHPVYVDRSEGSRVYDVDGNEYVDYLNAWGAIVLGHCDPEVNAAVTDAVDRQDLYGYGTTELEVEVAEEIIRHVPSAERAAFGVTGSEVTAHATRLARAVTGRQKIVKFQGHYHGWYDSLAMNHLTDEDKLGTNDPDTAGLLPEIVDETIVLPFNDDAAIEETFREQGEDIAAVILEPIAHNMGCVRPAEGYLETLRELTEEYGSLLIFDEIITGFRHDMGGAQALEGVIPDLTTLGKSIANGYPMSVLCGKAEYMEQFTTAGGDVAFGGTYNAHASSLAAAKATMDLLQERNFHAEAMDKRDRICAALEDYVEDLGLPAIVERYGTVFLTYFTEEAPMDYRDTLAHDTEAYTQYRWEMVDRGILMVPKDIRRNYILDAHTDEDVARTIEAAGEALRTVAE